jgi:hypothetical protein
LSTCAAKGDSSRFLNSYSKRRGHVDLEKEKNNRVYHCIYPDLCFADFIVLTDPGKGGVEKDLFDLAKKQNSFFSYQRYLKQYPRGTYSDLARKKIASKTGAKAILKDNIGEYEEQLKKFPDSQGAGYIKYRDPDQLTISFREPTHPEA